MRRKMVAATFVFLLVSRITTLSLFAEDRDHDRAAKVILDTKTGQKVGRR